MSGLMILSLGMALRIKRCARGRQVGVLPPCVLSKLALSPLVVWAGTRLRGVAQPFAADDPPCVSDAAVTGCA